MNKSRHTTKEEEKMEKMFSHMIKILAMLKLKSTLNSARPLSENA